MTFTIVRYIYPNVFVFSLEKSQSHFLEASQLILKRAMLIWNMDLNPETIVYKSLAEQAKFPLA